MKVALTGASGIVGQFMQRRLLAEGCEVNAIRRGADGELGDAKRLAGLLDGSDALIHAAFQHAPGRYRGGEGNDVAAFWEANFMGTVSLLKAAQATGTPRVVLISSRAAFTNPAVAASGALLHDEFPQRPDSHYGALKVASENLGKAFAAAGSMTVSCLRPTGVYGLVTPLARTKWYELARATLAGKASSWSATELTRVTTEVHGQDVAAAAWLLLQAPAAKVNGKGFNCSDLQVSLARVQHIMATGKDVATSTSGGDHASGRMSCEGLARLGWQPGGDALLLKTIAELVATCRTEAQ